METTTIGPGVIWRDVVWQVAPEQEQAVAVAKKTTVLDVARKFDLKAGNKDVREVGHGEMPDPGHPVKVGRWILMRTADYQRIVPQEVLNTARIYLDNDADIKCFLIADDQRDHKLREFRRLALRAFERVRTFDWQPVRSAAAQGTSTLVSTISSIVASISGRVKQKAEEIDWRKVGTILWRCLKAVALATGVVVVAVAALPLLALVAVPFALLSYDPWLIAVDSENRFWVIAEWYD